MNVQELSSRYAVRRLTKSDIDEILALCAGNPLFYRYHPPRATCDSIRADMAALPPNAQEENKFYLGYFAGERLCAVLDLILDWPGAGIAYIGFFMMAAEKQGKGIGSSIVAELSAALKKLNVRELCLAIDRGNPQSEAFWRKNGFLKADTEQREQAAPFLPMLRML